MKDKQAKFTVKWKAIGLFVIGLLLGIVVAHFIWLMAIQGWLESDAQIAILSGTQVEGTLEAMERFEDGYLAGIQTDRFGLVTIKVSFEEHNKLEIGSHVRITYNFGLQTVS